jgi:hypothetical protein
MHADKVMVYMRWRETGKPEPNSKNTVTLNSAEGDVSEAGAQVRTTKKLEPVGVPQAPSMLSHVSSSSKPSELNVEIVDGNSKRGKCPLRLQTRTTA